MRISFARLLPAACLSLAAVLGSTGAATAQAWPQKNVRFIIPFGPGSGADISARMISDTLQKKWGKPVVIENRPGGDAMVAINAFTGAADDHVLLYGAVASFVAHPYLYEKLSYVRAQDLLPIARISVTVMAVGVPAQSGMKTLKDLVAHAKANPGKLNSASVQGMSEIIFYGWMKREGIEIPKVPYRDIVQAPTDVGEGRLQVVMASLAAMRPMVLAGKVRVLGVGNKRTPAFPDLPTITEAGYPALDHAGLIGVFGPKGMPLELRKRIGSDIVAAGSVPVVTDRLNATGQLPAYAGPEELEKSIAEMNRTLDAAAQALGMKRKN